MRRQQWLALGPLFLSLGVAIPGQTQGGAAQAIVIEDPRPSPVLPIALVPFLIGSEVCRGGHQPSVSFRVYNVFGRPEATLHLRSRRAEVLDSLALRCGGYAAIWDGLIDGGQHVARTGIYYLRLTVDDRIATRQVVVP